MEASQEKRTTYLEAIKDIPLEKLVYIDESGIDHTICKDRGWAKKSQKVIGRTSGNYYQGTTIVAGLVNNDSIAPRVVNGTCNTSLFEAWVDLFLLNELKPGQVGIMNNAAFHKSHRTKDLIKSAGCKVIFLPPYSPDLNPIENFWANMNKGVKAHIGTFDKLYDALLAFFDPHTST